MIVLGHPKIASCPFVVQKCTFILTMKKKGKKKRNSVGLYALIAQSPSFLIDRGHIGALLRCLELNAPFYFILRASVTQLPDILWQIDFFFIPVVAKWSFMPRYPCFHLPFRWAMIVSTVVLVVLHLLLYFINHQSTKIGFFLCQHLHIGAVH